ncbi:MAG: hypothetical protein NZ743_03655, partial [Pseudomonadales bacterium]|nr:hypothetical protein [Pseudomonadales bacterium]
MQNLAVTTVFCCLLAISGCTTTSTQPADYSDLIQSIQIGEVVSVEEMKLAFLDTPDLPQRLQQMATLEQQALQLLIDEPLKLGAIGTAILDIYYGSLAGHLALASFY